STTTPDNDVKKLPCADALPLARATRNRAASTDRTSLTRIEPSVFIANETFVVAISLPTLGSARGEVNGKVAGFDVCPTAVQKTVQRPVSVQGRRPIDREIFRCFSCISAGTHLEVQTVGRVGSTGCVTSGRRWHRRIPPFVSLIRRGPLSEVPPSRYRASADKSHDANAHGSEV